MAAAVGAVVGLYVGLTAVLMGLSVLMERHADSYPWRSEDYMRYLLPSLYGGDGSDRILITGPSEAREDLLYEAFDAAFPGRRAMQGGLSLGTFRDLLLGLEYWEKTFGSEAVPRTIVLGITTRWVADIPRAESPLSSTITRYSPRFRVVIDSDEPTLTEKSALERAVSFARYIDKQPMRYRATVCTMFQQALGGGGSVAAGLRDRADDPPRGPGRVLAFLEECRSPYKFHHLTPMKVEDTERWMSSPGSFWHTAHHWNPDDDAAMVLRSFERLRSIVERLGIDIFVVNLPEHPSNRAAFDPAYYARYEDLVAEGTQGWPVLDLRTLLPLADFYDAGHATARGAIRTTEETIRFVRQELASRTEAADAPESSPARVQGSGSRVGGS